MRTLTKTQDSYFDELRTIGDVPLKNALKTLNYDDAIAYMKLVYEHGPDIGQILLGDDVDDPQKVTFTGWWEATLALGCTVLESTYGEADKAAASTNKPKLTAIWKVASPKTTGPTAKKAVSSPKEPAPDAKKLPAFSDVLPFFPISELNQTRLLFHQYGTEIGSALLLAALPQAYATSWGARVLAATGHLQNDRPGDLTRRIRATAQFVTFVLGPSGFVKEGNLNNGAIENAWDPRSPDTGQAFRSVMGLRLLHQVIRTILTEAPDKAKKAIDDALGPKNYSPNQPLNQEDLLATQLLFCITVFEVLEKFGLSWSTEDQMAYLTTWTLIGRLLGIESLDVQRCPELDTTSVEGARRLLELLRIRQWKPVPAFVAEVIVHDDASVRLDEVWNSLRPGRRLTKALLDELAAGMGNHFRAWPLATMRELAPPVVRDRLGLGASGLCMSLLDNLPHRKATIGWFTTIRMPNTVKATTIRYMANTVTRDAVISFLRSTVPPPFVLPGLEDWTASLPGVGK